MRLLCIFMLGVVVLLTSSITLANLGNNREMDRFYKQYIQGIEPLQTPIKIDYNKPIRFLETQDMCYTAEEPTSKIQFTRKKLSYEEMSEIAKDVVEQLPKIKSTPEVIKLLTETAITESDGGYYINTKGMGGLGITQVNYETAKYLLTKLKDSDIRVLDRLKDDSLSLKENLTYNLHFNMAMCALYYYHRKSNRIYRRIKSIDGRANLWKEVYNTSEGSGTPDTYKNRVRSYQEDD